jgi:hypothetical protein
LGRLVRAVAAAIAIALLVWSGLTWRYTHFVPDDTWEDVRTYLQENVPNGTKVAVTSDTGQFLMQGYRVEYVRTLEELRSFGPSYVVVRPTEIRLGYGAELDLIAWVESNGTPVHVSPGRAISMNVVYALPPAASSDAGSATVTGDVAATSPPE